MLFQELKPLKTEILQIIIEIKKSDICGIYPLSGKSFELSHFVCCYCPVVIFCIEILVLVCAGSMGTFDGETAHSCVPTLYPER
jgi:hypothetical protein